MIVLGASSCMGVLFGITFGAMDVEDKQMF